ncbi:MAG: adenylate kinase [Phormidesmis sp.]|mgnify:CR=1 FL=1
MASKQFIFLGPPGAGKGTQAATLAARWQVPHISTGDILRGAITAQTPLGTQAKACVDAGELVDDELVLDLMRDRFAQSDMENGWILDGFPRSLAQAEAFDHLLKTLKLARPKVVYFKVMTGLLIDRLLGMKRPDDTVATIRRRLAVYQEETTPLLEYYQQQDCVTTVNASLGLAEVANALRQLEHAEVSVTASFITDEAEFEGLLAQAQLLVVDCTATWCGPCKLVAPMMDRLAAEYGDRVNVFKLDVDAHKAVATRFKVKGVPLVMFLKEGELLESMAGVKPYPVFQAAVARWM